MARSYLEPSPVLCRADRSPPKPTYLGRPVESEYEQIDDKVVKFKPKRDKQLDGKKWVDR